MARAPRFAIRWHWTMLVGVAVLVSILVLFLIVLDMERDAWLNNQATQSEVQVDRLADELKIPMLAGGAPEVDLIVQSFLKKVPDAMGVYLHYANDEDQSFGSLDISKTNVHEMLHSLIHTGEKLKKVDESRMWYIRQVEYAQTHVGTVVVRFSEHAWEDLASEILKRISIAALFVLTLSSVLVYWIAGRMSRPLEDLAAAAGRVAGGDYTVRLPVRGNNELSDAITQFNELVRELEHKEEIRSVFGRYLNPKLVSDVFEGGDVRPQNYRQEVTVLFADMVGFTSFSESSSTEEVVEVLNKHFEVFHRVIDYYGGHVDKYIGDAVMAVFNHPNEDPEHVQHAAMAGLAITMACEKLGAKNKRGEPISFRVGLNRGHVIVGNIGAAERLQYTVIGDTVNVASRMAGLGEGGQVIMTYSTYADMHTDQLRFDSIGKREIKGVSQPIRCGAVAPDDEQTRRNLEHVVNLAFELSLPVDIRQIEGDVAGGDLGNEDEDAGAKRAR